MPYHFVHGHQLNSMATTNCVYSSMLSSWREILVDYADRSDWRTDNRSVG